MWASVDETGGQQSVCILIPLDVEELTALCCDAAAGHDPGSAASFLWNRSILLVVLTTLHELLCIPKCSRVKREAICPTVKAWLKLGHAVKVPEETFENSTHTNACKP